MGQSFLKDQSFLGFDLLNALISMKMILKSYNKTALNDTFIDKNDIPRNSREKRCISSRLTNFLLKLRIIFFRLIISLQKNSLMDEHDAYFSYGLVRLDNLC
jgi:hypothetical protein